MRAAEYEPQLYPATAITCASRRDVSPIPPVPHTPPASPPACRRGDSACKRRDRRRDAQQLGGALDQARHVARRHAAFRIQLGQQFADAAMRVAEHRPAQRQRLEHGAAERFGLIRQLQHQRADRIDFAHIVARRADRELLRRRRAAAASCFEFGDVGFAPGFARAEQQQAAIESARAQAGQQFDGVGDGPSGACRGRARSAVRRRAAAGIRAKNCVAPVVFRADSRTEIQPDRCRAESPSGAPDRRADSAAAHDRARVLDTQITRSPRVMIAL